MKRTLIIWLLRVPSFAVAQLYSEVQAKQQLRILGIMSSCWIEDAELIRIEGCVVKGEGGLCVDLPIPVCVTKDHLMVLGDATAYLDRKGNILVKADGLTINAVYFNTPKGKFLVVGESFKAIVNAALSEER
jgi:hypothetical protein